MQTLVPTRMTCIKGVIACFLIVIIYIRLTLFSNLSGKTLQEYPATFITV